MVTIRIDGSLVHSTMTEDEAYIALNVKPTLDIEEGGSLSFVLPPGNAQYDAIRRMKSIVTMYQDDVLLFRGRVTECETDSYNQKNVYCEGDRAFLNDSLWEEQTVTGKVLNFFRQLIENHNAQVEEEKRFTVGVVTAVDADTPIEGEQRIETRRHWDTASILNDRLLSVYGGYIRTRTEGGVTYIDWLKEFEEESGQTIAFSVNLLDLKDKMDAGGVFTVLIPLGYSEIGEDGTYEDPVNIKSVNGGLEYIEDAEAVARYGRIWRSKTWGNTKDPATLKEKGLEYLRTGGELRTLEIKAVDMHLTDGQVEMIKIGTKVHIQSDPHGIDIRMVCAKIEPDIDNPENTVYTFGVKPRTLTEAVIRNERETGSLTGRGGRGGGGGKSALDELGDVYRWAKINVDEANGKINLNAGEIDKLTGRMNTAEINIDGANANILMNATAIDDLNGRVSSAEIEIDGANANISMNATAIDEVSGRVSSAEIAIDGANARISMNATAIDEVSGRVSSAELILNGAEGEAGLVAKVNDNTAAITLNANEIESVATIKADKVYVDAEITEVKKLVAQEIDAAIADLDLSISETIVTNYLTVKTKATLSALALGGSNVSTTTLPIVTSFTQALGESAPTKEYTLLTVA